MLNVEAGISGLFLGGAYALIGVTLTLMYRSTGVLSFAHAAFAAVSAYLYIDFVDRGMAKPLAAALAVAGATVYGLVVERVAIRPVRSSDPATRLIAERDKVAALITGLADNTLDYVDSKKVPPLTFGVSPTAFSSKYPTVFPIVGNALLWTQEIIAAYQKNGIIQPGMKVGMIYDNTVIDISPYLPQLEQPWENVGAQVVSVDPFNLQSGSCESLVLKYRNLGVDFWDFQSAAWFLCIQAGQPEHLDSPALLGYWAGAKLLVDGLKAQGDTITGEGLTKWMQDIHDYPIGVMPRIISMAPNCKTGSEAVWAGQWHYDAATKTASRKPTGGYFTSPQKQKSGGKCFLTKLSDKILASQ